MRLGLSSYAYTWAVGVPDHPPTWRASGRCGRSRPALPEAELRPNLAGSQAEPPAAAGQVRRARESQCAA
jgi:hypothetical protein